MASPPTHREGPRVLEGDPQTSTTDDLDHEENRGPVVDASGVKSKVKVTPLPKLKMVAVAATLLTESICTTMLLPFVGLYVAHLQNISVEAAGYSSGILVGLFMLGQVVSSKMWGWLSDVYGRRVPLTMGLFIGAWAMLFFGMAPNIYICCIMRFIHGFFNGNVLIAKIILSDITDGTNAALGFSMIGILWSIGAVAGPAIGGFLYDPFKNPKLQWLHVKEGSFLERNPAFLASFVLFIYTLLTFLLCVAIVPETNPHRTGSLRTVPVIGWILNWLRPKTVAIVEPDDTPAGVDTPEKEEGGAEAVAPAPTMTYKRALSDPVIRTVTVLLMCLAAADMTFTEILPLWAIAPKEVGGLAMFSDSVGIIMLCFAVPTLLTNLSFSSIYRKVQSFSIMWRWGVSIFAVSVFLVPFAALMSDRPAFWYVLLMGSIKNSSCSGSFTIVQLLTGRAASPGTVGAVYGISQSLGASVRCVVPFVVAPLFAWSISGGHTFPFNHYFVFFLSLAPLIFAFWLSEKHPMERSEEELGEWAKENESAAGGRGNDCAASEAPTGTRAVNEDYRSLATTYAVSQANNVFRQLPGMEAENARQSMVADWMRHIAPTGRGQRLQSSVKNLQHEDWRVVTDEDVDDDESDEMEIDGDNFSASARVSRSASVISPRR